MRILVADDDAVFRKLYLRLLEHHGHDPVLAENGEQAWQALQRIDAPRFAVLDWMMPGIEGVDLCRRLRRTARHRLSYLIVVTSRSNTVDLVTALDAGADDFLAKPFSPSEFLARIRAGVRSLTRQDLLLDRLVALQAAASSTFRNAAVVPVCMYCKSVRDPSDCWHERDDFLAATTGPPLSHGICPACEDGIVAPMLEQAESDGTENGRVSLAEK